jgi:hypothetical protein
MMVSVALTGAASFLGGRTALFWSAIAVAILPLVYFFSIFALHAIWTPWALWLPVIAPFFAGVVMYVERELDETSDGLKFLIQRLEQDRAEAAAAPRGKRHAE